MSRRSCGLSLYGRPGGRRLRLHPACGVAITGLNERAVEVLMAGGWASDGAVQDQIDSSIEDAVQRARSQLPSGPGLERCEECDAKIPEARRQAIPGVRL